MKQTTTTFKLEPGSTARWPDRKASQLREGQVIMQIEPGIAVTAEEIRQTLVAHGYDPVMFNGDLKKYAGIITRASYLIAGHGKLHRPMLFRVADDQVRTCGRAT